MTLADLAKMVKVGEDFIVFDAKSGEELIEFVAREVNGNTATAGPSPNGPPIAAGGIANGGTAELDHSQVDNNTATRGIGAGIVNHAMMTVSHSEVNGNTAAASGNNSMRRHATSDVRLSAHEAGP